MMKPHHIQLIYQLAYTPRAVAIIEGELLNGYQAALIYTVIESIQNQRLQQSLMHLPLKNLMELAVMIGERQIEVARNRDDDASQQFLQSVETIRNGSIPL